MSADSDFSTRTKIVAIPKELAQSLQDESLQSEIFSYKTS